MKRYVTALGVKFICRFEYFSAAKQKKKVLTKADCGKIALKCNLVQFDFFSLFPKTVRIY